MGAVTAARLLATRAGDAAGNGMSRQRGCWRLIWRQGCRWREVIRGDLSCCRRDGATLSPRQRLEDALRLGHAKRFSDFWPRSRAMHDRAPRDGFERLNSSMRFGSGFAKPQLAGLRCLRHSAQDVPLGADVWPLLGTIEHCLRSWPVFGSCFSRSTWRGSSEAFAGQGRCPSRRAERPYRKPAP